MAIRKIPVIFPEESALTPTHRPRGPVAARPVAGGTDFILAYDITAGRMLGDASNTLDVHMAIVGHTICTKAPVI